MPDGKTPEEEYRRVLRGVDEGNPPSSARPSRRDLPRAGYGQDDLARDLGIEPGDRALPRAMSAYAAAFTGGFWQETERAAREPRRLRQPARPPKTRPGEKRARQRGVRAGKNRQYGNTAERQNSRGIPKGST